ncbi:hypothetical protein [Streptomyces sclerotialus]|uniref:hypothetical protein n=1 Tax=Streptomyces sclerotialus TaxID=1957 RepID=UPI0018C99128
MGIGMSACELCLGPVQETFLVPLCGRSVESRLVCTELPADGKGKAAAAFLGGPKGWFAAYGITHIHRVVTDNGACCRSGGFACIVGAKFRNQHTKPYPPTPQRQGRASPADHGRGVLYARECNREDERIAALDVWNIRYSCHRSRSVAGGRPAASRLTTHYRRRQRPALVHLVVAAEVIDVAEGPRTLLQSPTHFLSIGARL